MVPSTVVLFSLTVTGLGVALASRAAAGPSPAPAGALRLRDVPDAVVVVVQVPSPWYAPRFAIVRKFRAAVPEYQALPGLARKAFTFDAQGAFGGVYLWPHRADAEAHFSPAWHARVRALRGVDGRVRLFPVSRVLDAPEPPVAEGDRVVTVGPEPVGGLERLASIPGVRSAAAGEGRVVVTWERREDARAFLGDATAVEWFDAPVVIDNGRR